MASGKGVIAGKVLMPRDIAAECHRHWQNYELTKAVAVSLAESTGALGAYHDNFNDAQKLASRDCGLFQINILASQIGTAREDELRTESLVESVWRPVLTANVDSAKRLYDQPWSGRERRLWQPWVAYTTGWAMFAEWWVWHQDADGNPVGPWLRTGRYVQRAIAGQMNYHLVTLKDWTAEQALYYGARYQRRFGVEGVLYVEGGVLKWRVPAKPTSPPADGVGPRPTTNDGT